MIPASWDPHCGEPRSHLVWAPGISAGPQEASEGRKCDFESFKVLCSEAYLGWQGGDVEDATKEDTGSVLLEHLVANRLVVQHWGLDL